MAVVELLLPALPAHVRTARLVVLTAARRAGLVDGLVDEVRFAVGEACARAVGQNVRHAPQESVAVTVTDDVLGLTVAVHDRGPAAGPAVADVAGGLLGDDGDGRLEYVVDPDVALALLTGLVDEVEVTDTPGVGTTVTMRWPLPARIVAGVPSTQVSRP